ncbi:MAG: hypothetical protein EBY29_00675 [Planctomycetes bacterium]|jgi:hypothetical protein|nr:hypothetical protein [Planctomycetota bacterium]
MSQPTPESEVNEPEWLLPFEAMEVGDSFFIPTLKPANLIYVIDTRAKAAKYKVRSAIVLKDGYLGVRAWRVR